MDESPDDGVPGCSDVDGDGYGVGASCEGADCNDHVATIHEEAECEAFCAEGVPRPGCPCENAEPTVCYTGPAETLGVGPCHAGLTSCADGHWGACEGQVDPVEEVCDTIDNDCDAEVDEGITNECGTCGECLNDCFGPDCGGWGEDTSSGLVETPEGWLSLDGTTRTSLHVIWPSSQDAGEIFRVDTETLEVQAVFWTGPNHGGESPSRTAVDDDGNVIVANRAYGLQASITKIAADPEVCPDRNGNGDVDTSTAWNDKLAFDAFDDWQDECILWNTPVGAVGNLARALAIHRTVELDGVVAERGWVGLHTGYKVVQFDPQTGELTGVEAPTGSYTPYGGAIDRDGWMWLSGWPSDDVGHFDTDNPERSFEIVPLPVPNQQALRVLVDENNAPWVSGADAYRWNRRTEEWQGAGVGVGGGKWDQALGSIASDGQGSVWAGTYNTEELVYRIDNDDDMDWHTVPTPGVLSFGMACDFDGQCWAFGSRNNAAVIDVETEESQVALTDCAGPCLRFPYVRGDITGLQRTNALNPVGRWASVVEGCVEGATEWSQLIVTSRTPPGSSITLAARTAETVAGLAPLGWTNVGAIPPGDGTLDLGAAFDAADVEEGRFLEVQASLQSEDRKAQPFLMGIEVRFGCEDTVD